MNKCSACKRDFGSLSAFDKHQDVNYKRQPVVVCKDPSTIGMHKDKFGRWRSDRVEAA